MSRIYLDHNATTPVSGEILATLPRIAEAFGNPSSIHWSGREPKALLRESRLNVAKAIGAQASEIVFTSGATEATNTIVKSVFEAFLKTPRQIYITTRVEHPSVRECFNYLQSKGAQVHFLEVNLDGQLDMEFLERLLSQSAGKLALVSIMAANNETGVIFPIPQISKWVHAAGGLMHSDCVQAFGKVPVSVLEMGLDYASFSGHKIYSLKGAGFAFVKRGAPWIPLLHGGAQERHRRGGTENTLSIWSLGFMAERLEKGLSLQGQIAGLRDYFEHKICSRISGISVTGSKAPRLANTSSLIIEGVDGESLLMNLDLKGVAVSTGAACASGNPEPSPVLLAMGLTRIQAQSSLRVSLGWHTTQEEIDEFLEILVSVVHRLRTLQTEFNSRHQDQNMSAGDLL